MLITTLRQLLMLLTPFHVKTDNLTHYQITISYTKCGARANCMGVRAVRVRR